MLVNPDKVYLGTAEGDFKKRYYKHKNSYRDKRYTNDISLSKYIWEIKEKYRENAFLKWSIVKRVPPYSSITKKCLLCLLEKLEIVYYPDDLTIFKCFRVIFSLKKKNIKFPLSFNLYFL